MTPIGHFIGWLDHLYVSTDWYEVGRFLSAVIVGIGVSILIYALLMALSGPHQ